MLSVRACLGFRSLRTPIIRTAHAFARTDSFSDRILLVQDNDEAKRVLRILEANGDKTWACDTEVADIDLKKQGPVGNGVITCFSLYGGPDVDFGGGKKGSVVWVDNLGPAAGVLNLFKSWFENSEYVKVWHNYGFDRHVLYNENIDCQGFGGDTMHMARLWNSYRDKSSGGDGYSLESLSADLVTEEALKKKSMKELFGVAKKKKDGDDSKILVIPDVRELQTNPLHRDEWIVYSAKDAVATWQVYQVLKLKLQEMEWVADSKRLGNMYDFYSKYLRNFGELLTDMERVGIMVDTKGHLREAELRAHSERRDMENIFYQWASKYCKDAQYINTASTSQIQQLLFGGFVNRTLAEKVKTFKIDKSPEEISAEEAKVLAINPFVNCTVSELKLLLKAKGLKHSGGRADLMERLIANETSAESTSLDANLMEDIRIARGGTLPLNADAGVDSTTAKCAVDSVSKVKKYREISIETIGLQPQDFTPTGVPQVSASVLKSLAGKDLFGDEKEAVWGTAFDFFGRKESAKEACRAIGALASIGQIDTTIANFLVPLQTLVDNKSRVHCSLNLNTETGRLSARRPNLQNQPALEKDQYKIRDAFIAEPGNTLIVADYGQLELRILAHITGCKSMIDAFSSGGCFHSRTAVGMYDYIREDVKSGKVLLEWDYSKGRPTSPLVKDKYGSERRKAKTLNFSIAYGKTVHGLAADWGISIEEAESTLEAWYRDRPEVRLWQENTRKDAKRLGFVRTIMGRCRLLPDASGRGPAAGHALRAAINTPIQGSAADVVMMAMIKIWKSSVLKNIGWKLLLQIHDEVILEGPKSSVDEAMAEVRRCMEDPFDGFGLSPLNVHLDVDAKSADSWYKAK